MAIQGSSQSPFKEIDYHDIVKHGLSKDGGVECGKVITAMPDVKPGGDVVAKSHNAGRDGPIERDHLPEIVPVTSLERLP